MMVISNINLQRAIKKYGISCFYLKRIMFKIKTTYLSFFKFKFLYNFKIIVTSMLGYKHNIEAK